MLKKKKPGFTLLEVMIVAALTVVVIGVVTSVFITGNRIFSDSNIKSTLQTDGQAIHEKISAIGMQAIGIESVSGNESTGEIQNIKINSYDKDGNKKVFEINKQSKRLFIEGNKVSDYVESIKIDPQIIADYNTNPSLLVKYAYIDFNITLSKNRSYDNAEITYPVNVQTVFRNRSAVGS